MDKLKPIIVHKFWIILAIAMLLPVVGWSMATGNLAKEIAERKTALDKAFSDAQVPPNPPNQTWSTALSQINKEKDYAIGLSWKRLWDKQKSLFVWPADITLLMKKTPYRGEISRVPRNLYRSAYEKEILRAHQLAKPFSLKDGTGQVDINPNIIPHVPLDKWKTLPPTSKEMWDAQEDVWLVSSIFEAIAEVNKGAGNISEAPVRQISVLELRGGTPGGGAGEDAGGDDANNEGMAEAGGFNGGGGRARKQGGDGKQNIDIDLDLSEIFGSDADNSAADESGGEDAAEPENALGGFGGSSGNGGASKNLKRYYDEAEELPYKTRAFYIKAVIESGKLPNLITQLTNMPWPAQILRVQRVDLLDDNLVPITNIDGGAGNRRGGGNRSRRGGGGGGPEFTVEGSESDGRAGRGDSASQANQKLLDAALDDPQLAVVTIAGLMTLYKPYVPPEGVEVVENKPNEENSDQPSAEPANADTSDEKQTDVPAGDSPQEPTDSTEPKQPIDSKPGEAQTPKTDAKPEEPVNN